MKYIENYLSDSHKVIDLLDNEKIHATIQLIVDTRENNGRIFFLGVGGGAGHASHAVNDFRKICGIEAYSPSDNVSELTARVNDDGWETAYVNWLKISKLNSKDLVFIISVGGGNLEKNVSVNILESLKHAKIVGANICGIVGRDGGYTAKVADVCIIVPTVTLESVTPLVESFQAVIWHLIVSHPDLQQFDMKWESI
jgi:D-sedoheptulose 7-phosphate isomerase